MADWNRKQIPTELLSELEDVSVEMKQQKRNTGSFIDVFRYPNVALKSINIFLGWLGQWLLCWFFFSIFFKICSSLGCSCCLFF